MDFYGTPWLTESSTSRASTEHQNIRGTPTYYEPSKQATNETNVYASTHYQLNRNEAMSLKEDIPDESYNKKTVISDRMSNKYSDPFQKPVRKCAGCKKPPQMQCLHCSKQVCMDCAQEHVALATEQIDVAHHILNDKMSVIDRLSAAAKERIDADRNRIIKQADIERDQAFAQIDQLAEQQKKQMRDKSGQLSELPLDEITSFIQHMTSEMEYITETNNQLFRINSILPKIQVRQELSSHYENL